MPLTKSDLKAIGDIVDQKLEEKLEQKLEQKLDQKLDQKLAPIHKDLNKIKTSLATTINFFDNDNLKLKKRVTRIEDYLNLPPTH